MSKRKAVSIVIVVLMLASASWGSILQGQGFAIGTDNMIHLTQGETNGSSTQNLLIDLNQSSEGTGLAMIGASAYGVTSQSGGVGALGQISVSRVHSITRTGLGGLAMPIVPSPGIAGLQLAQARLAGLVNN